MCQPKSNSSCDRFCDEDFWLETKFSYWTLLAFSWTTAPFVGSLKRISIISSFIVRLRIKFSIRWPFFLIFLLHVPSPSLNFLSIGSTPISHASKSLLAWRMAFYATAWLIGNVRNHIIFHHEVFGEYTCLKLFCYHYAWWVRKTLEDFVSTIADISRCPSSVTSPPQRITPHTFWSPPFIGTIKVNVDNCFTASNDQGEIESLFRDDHKNPLFHFWKQINADLAIHAEILTIRKDFLIATSSHWTHSANFIFESDSFNVVLWCFQLFRVPWHFQNTVIDVLPKFNRDIQWFINYI